MNAPLLHKARSAARINHYKAIAFGAVLAIGLIAFPIPASAYTTTGCSWSTGTLQIDIRYVNGNFRTAINSAVGNYDTATVVRLSAVDSTGPSWTAQNASYGATGWEGNTSWFCFLGTTHNAQMKLNQYYLTGLEPVARLRVVWEHEMGHALGLGHVSSITHVMYPSASAAYFAGVIWLSSDDIVGINSLY